MIAYKFLREDGTGAFSGFAWPLPTGEPGAWVEATVEVCRSGIHACRVGDMPLWVGRALYEVELDGETVEEGSKVVAPRGRLTRRIDAWDDATRDAYTRMCADRAHDLARDGALQEWEQLIEPSVAEGPALVGFLAARIAEQIDGPGAYVAERASQAGWLAARLGIA